MSETSLLNEAVEQASTSQHNQFVKYQVYFLFIEEVVILFSTYCFINQTKKDTGKKTLTFEASLQKDLVSIPLKLYQY